MKKTKILWSGITGRTGKLAEKFSKTCDCAEVVAGLSRNDENYYNYNEIKDINVDFDVIVDFSHKDSFYKVLDYAIKVKKPLISGTSGLSEEMLIDLEKASHIIPIFRGGNFRPEIEKFIDDVVEYSKTHDQIKLVETHYKTKKIPSETAKVVARRVFEETGKQVVIKSYLKYKSLINDWKVDSLHARVGTNGFETLALNVLNIANVMENKKPNGLYDLKSIYHELNENEMTNNIL